MAVYTYDEEADALYILLVADREAAIESTVTLTDRLHVDIDPAGNPVGIEILYPSKGSVDLAGVRERFGIEVRVPFTFAA